MPQTYGVWRLKVWTLFGKIVRIATYSLIPGYLFTGILILIIFLLCTLVCLKIGFGIAAQSTAYVKELDPTANVVLHQCDVGEYLRFEDEMFN